jgi:hypothetical protein
MAKKKMRASVNRGVVHKKTGQRTVHFWGKPVYTDVDFDAIADAISISPEKVREVRDMLENAAGWYRSDQRDPQRTAPSQVRRNLRVLRKAIHRIIGMLEDRDIADAIGYEAQRRRSNLDDTTRALANLAEWASSAEPSTTYTSSDGRKSDLVARGHVGDAGVNDWVAEVLPVYTTLTGRAPVTSVSPCGIAQGPLIRFFIAASRPLEIELDEDAWRARVRRVVG